MITEIKVENYKSLFDFTMEVGRFNVLIGENGCGKSNILEAITLAGAAEKRRLDKGFLKDIGIRVTEPELMRSAFDDEKTQYPMKIIIKQNELESKYILHHENKPFGTWEQYSCEKDYIDRIKKGLDPKSQKMATELLFKKIESDSFYHFEKFMIYSLEDSVLKEFRESDIDEPLGVKGEGLLKFLKLSQQEYSELSEIDFFEDDIQEILEELFDWYECIEIPNNLIEKKLAIKDRYLKQFFDQYSANEGFLFVLFYIALITSYITPKIFAIENIDTSLNPKLCTKLITELTRLAKKYDKQVFVTTHNPAILDGIDLGDDEQRLLVISRNKQGHTRCKRIDLENKPRSSTDEPLTLSEAFLRGDLGGLPKGF